MAVVFSCVFGLFLFLDFSDSWRSLGITNMVPLFADTQALLAASDCHLLGYDVFKENPCDPWDRVHVYSSITLLLGMLGLTLENSTVLGWIIVLSFWVAALLIVRPRNLTQSLITLLCLLSPAMLLGAERANVDLFIFSLLAMSIWLVSKETFRIRTIAALPLMLVSVIKLYPAAALAALLLSAWKKPKDRLLWAMMMVLFLIWIIVQSDEIRTLAQVAPRPEGAYTFGSQAIFTILGINFSKTTMLLSLMVFALVFLVALFLSAAFPLHIEQLAEQEINAYLIGLAVLVFCFLAINNFDYRNIFFLLLLPTLFRITNQPSHAPWRIIAWLTLLLYVPTLWAELHPNNQLRLVENILTWAAMVPLLAIGLALLGWDKKTRQYISEKTA